MCLAIPAQVRTINENNLAVVDILGVTREVALDLPPRWAISFWFTPASPLRW